MIPRWKPYKIATIVQLSTLTNGTPVALMVQVFEVISSNIMKTIHNNLVCALVALSLGAVFTVQASDDKSPSPSFAVLSKATQIELPAKAAELVSQATPKQRQQTTIDVVKAALGLNPAAASAVVASIAHANPEVAAIAAATAASLLPDQAAEIARVAAAAAPKQAGQIVAAVCRVAPKSYKEIASAVAEAAPDQGKQILTGLASAMPTLQGPLNKFIATYGGNNSPTVSTVLNQVQPTPESQAPPAPSSGSVVLAPPTYGPPYVIPPGSHINLDPGSGVPVTPGGRDYAAP
jgi:hypothetical protein